MSYILDALKKSERQRRLSRDLVFHADARRLGATYAARVLVIVVAVTAVGAVLGAVLLNREQSLKESVAAGPAATPQTPSAEGGIEQTGDTDTAPLNMQSPGVSAPATTRIEVQDLADQAVTEKPPPSPKPAVRARTPRTSTQLVNPDRIPFLQEMPAEFQKQLPPLAVNIHVYAPDELQRILYINNRQYRRGDTLQDGIVVEDIVPDGVVLRYRGRFFKLPRPR